MTADIEATMSSLMNQHAVRCTASSLRPQGWIGTLLPFIVLIERRAKSRPAGRRAFAEAIAQLGPLAAALLQRPLPARYAR